MKCPCRFLVLSLVVALAASARCSQLYVEAESFAELGGWVVDPHSMKAIGSSYIMAHGIGKPVADARTTVYARSPGRYAVWAKTRDWSDEWREGRGSAPGRFRVAVNGAELGAELGSEGRDWHWQKAGEVDLATGAVDVALHDLTGFNGRCDALVFTDDLGAKPPFARPEAKVSDNQTTYDLAVVGGGMAGICMAQTAVRYGLKVLLLQDREVLGGCNSSEVRVGLGGAWHLPPYPNLGMVVDDLAPAFNNNRPLPPEFYEDARKANFFVRTKRNCDVLYREHVFAVETDPANPKRIAAVLSRNTHTGAVTRHRAALFADATGDATIARLAGCETMYGREERSRFNESCAPEKASRQVMGHSTQWTSRVADAPVPFPDIDWGFVLDESNAYHITEGGWEQEAGQYRDMADDTEAIRDYGLYAVFSNWSYLKNRSPRKAEWAGCEITWISPIGGKRESYRVVGDLVLTQNDIENHVRHPDLSAPMNWNIDLHFPDPDNEAKFKEPFRSCAYHRHYNGPYAIPYRCLYARDSDNLFLAGRDISCSHVAFAATRVMGTLGVCGEVAGMAAAVCRKNACMPRDVYEKHLGELKKMMEKGAPRLGFYHSGGCVGENEFYHFKSDDKHERPQVYPNPSQLTPEQERKIRTLGIQHRHEHPQLKQARLECDVAVAGGGSAGFAAAWSAAKRGVYVVLIEREDALGGTSTVGGVSSWEPVCGARGLPELVYERLKKEGQAGVYRFVHHGCWSEKDGLARFPGALLEIDRDAPYSATLRRHGPGIADEKWFRTNCRGVIFDPDAMSRTMRAMLDETGRCRVMTGISFVSAKRDGGRITALRLSDGTVLEPKVVIDACGAVAKSVGCELMESDRPNGASLIYRVVRSDGASEPPGQPQPCWWAKWYPSAFCMTLPNGEIAVNMLPTMSGEEVKRLGESAAFDESRCRVEAHWRWMQSKWPAFSGWRICHVASRLAHRETFRVRGDYVLTCDDVRRGVRPPDEIASADHALDSHGGEGFGGELKAPYGIPYRCLVAAGMDNLLLAGRIASFDTKAASSCRLSRTMMKLGEAVGAAAALATQNGRSIRTIGAAEIRAAVERNEGRINEE